MHLLLVAFTLALLSSSNAFRFTSPPFLASFGEIYSPSPRSFLPYPPVDFFKRNFSVFIPPDYIGCNPVPVPPNTAVWYFSPVPCGGGGKGFQALERMFAWQQAGAEALLVAQSSGPADLAASGIYSSGGTEAAKIRIPVQVFRFLKNFYYDADPVTNPDISLFVGLFIPGFNNISATMAPTDPGIIFREQSTVGSTWSALQWTSWTVSLVAVFVATIKLGQFMLHEGGLKMSLPQICLIFVLCASGFLHIYYTFGPIASSSWFPLEVAFALNFFWEPLFLGALITYCFYLVELASLGQGGVSEIRLFLWPALICTACIFVLLMIGNITVAAFPANTNFNQITLAVWVSYAIVFGLAIILLVVSTIVCIVSLLETNRNAQIVRLAVSNFLLLFSLSLSFSSKVILCLQASPGGWLWNFNQYMISVAFTSFASWIGCITLALQFRVSVQKEIEISKSATSGTSNASSGSYGSSSSGSSNHGDSQVIEL